LIRVVDAETHFSFGYAIFPLNNVLRGDKAYEMSHKEVEIISFDWKLITGYLTVMVENVG